MKEFLSHHSYIIIWVLALVIVGSIAALIVQLNGITTGPLVTPRPIVLNIPPAPAAPATPPPTTVVLTIVKSPTGNSLVVQWQNLPSNTTKLDIFRGKTATTTVWALWKTVTVTQDELANGSANINVGQSPLDGYSFYVQADSGDDNSSSTDGNDGGTPLWVSSSTVPIETTNPPPPLNGGGAPPPSGNSSSSNPTSSSTPSSTSPTPPPSSPVTPTSSSPSGNGNPPPIGNPYYNPEVQITGYGTAPGSFWVEHVNQSIEIGWQNLPPGIESIVVTRSASSTGPWNPLITQQNPGTSGSYSLQLIDNTVGDPYYYEMTGFNGTTTIATYGPIYLAGQ